MIPTSSTILTCFKSTKQKCLLMLPKAKDILPWVVHIFMFLSYYLFTETTHKSTVSHFPWCEETDCIFLNYLNYSRKRCINIAKGRVIPGCNKYHVISAHTLPFSIHSTHIRWLLARDYWENDGKSLGVQKHPRVNTENIDSKKTIKRSSDHNPSGTNKKTMV